jgi:hypothetical protein
LQERENDDNATEQLTPEVQIVKGETPAAKKSQGVDRTGYAL